MIPTTVPVWLQVAILVSNCLQLLALFGFILVLLYVVLREYQISKHRQDAASAPSRVPTSVHCVPVGWRRAMISTSPHQRMISVGTENVLTSQLIEPDPTFPWPKVPGTPVMPDNNDAACLGLYGDVWIPIQLVPDSVRCLVARWLPEVDNAC